MKSATRVPYIMGESFLVDVGIDAGIDDGDFETGRFNAWSWSPIPLLTVRTVGWMLEYDRGYFGR